MEYSRKKYKQQKLPQHKELASYLNVGIQSIRNIRKEKRLIMLLGLVKKYELDNKKYQQEVDNGTPHK